MEGITRYILRPEHVHDWKPGKFKLTHYPTYPNDGEAQGRPTLKAFVCDADRKLYVRLDDKFVSVSKEQLLDVANYRLREAYVQALESCRVEETGGGSRTGKSSYYDNTEVSGLTQENLEVAYKMMSEKEYGKNYGKDKVY